MWSESGAWSDGFVWSANAVANFDIYYNNSRKPFCKTNQFVFAFFESILMPLFHINSFDDVRFTTLVTWADRLGKMKDTYLQALIYWSEEITRHDFGNDIEKLEHISGIILGKYDQLYVALEKTKAAEHELRNN